MASRGMLMRVPSLWRGVSLASENSAVAPTSVLVRGMSSASPVLRRDRVTEAADEAKSAASRVGNVAKDKLHGASGKVEGGAQEAERAAENLGRDAKRQAEDLGTDVKRASSDAAEKGKNVLDDIREKIKDTAEVAKDKIKKTIN